jgi:streptogrisin C
LDRAGAEKRLLAEIQAAETQRRIEGRRPVSYAGSWFDGASLKLMVAITDPEDASRVQSAGAIPTVVNWSMTELDAAFDQAEALRQDTTGDDLVRGINLDVQGNRIVVAAAPGQVHHVRGLLIDGESPFEVVEATETPAFSSGPIRGANGTRNKTWADLHGGVWPCSMTVAVTDGYLTAGHCGDVNHEMRTPAGVLLGTVSGSTFSMTWPNKDSAWLDVVTGWTPEAKINGYSDGTLNVPAKWAAMEEAPVSTTICRYGQTSGGPYCGTINSRTANETIGGYYFTDLIRVTGMCSDDGDSGGPHLALGGQVQGLTVGATATNTCPTSTTYVYVQPVKAALAFWTGQRMLTTHGAAAPTVPSVICPNMGSSGSGMYMCEFGHYNSQGTTTVSWTSSTSDTSSGPKLWGSCTPGYPVNVWLTITNPYGSYNYSKTFTCPTTIIP